MKIDKRIVYRILIYILGLMFLAFSVAIAINSNLGVSPVNSLPYIISQISGFAMGRCVTAIFLFFILLQILLLRRRFQWHNLLQIIFAAIFGYLVDFAKWVIGGFSIPTYPGQLTMLAISIVLIGVGITLYVNTRLIPLPTEGLSLALTEVIGKIKFHNIKIIIDCIIVLTGAVLSLVFLDTLIGIREGTVITAVFVGKVIGIVQKPLKPLIERICFQEQTAR